MVTAAAAAMKAVVSHVQPVLKAAGFRKRVHSFNRTVAPGLVHVIQYQMAPFDPPGLVEIPGMREKAYGLFSVNAGVFVEEAWRLEQFRFGPEGQPAEKTWINEHDCQVRRNITNPTPRSSHLQQFWSLVDPDMGLAMVKLLNGELLPWFDRFGSRAAILSVLENAPVESRVISGTGPDRLLAVRMRLGAGDREQAQRLFDQWVRHCHTDRDQLRSQGHLDFLSTYAERVGLTMPTADDIG